MSTVRSYRDLKVWQASMELVDACFDIVEAIPAPYRFVFCDQLLPAAISIASNIAEGSHRTRKGYMNHLSYSLGSQAEVSTILEVITRRRLVPAGLSARACHLSEPVGKMLHGLVGSLESAAAYDATAR